MKQKVLIAISVLHVSQSVSDAEIDTSISQGLESEGSSDEESDFEAGVTKPPATRLIATIFEHIASLYRVSVLLRRPTVHEKYIRSIPRDEGANSFEVWEKQHILEKIAVWTRKWSEAANSAPAPDTSADNPLIARLAAANCRRRAQLKFWQAHPDLQPTTTFPVVDTRQKGLKFGSQSQMAKEEEQSSSRTVTTEQRTHQSFTTVAASALNDDATTILGNSKTAYAQSAIGINASLRIPDVPKAPEGSLVFQCPYCFAELDVEIMQQRKTWK